METFAYNHLMLVKGYISHVSDSPNRVIRGVSEISLSRLDFIYLVLIQREYLVFNCITNIDCERLEYAA
jgi:hypothetical protein